MPIYTINPVIHVEVHQAEVRLDELLDRAVTGEQIVLTRRAEPLVRLAPERQPGNFQSLAGVWRSRVGIADDFDDLPVDLASTFET
jgi:prevent-host-death family protein